MRRFGRGRTALLPGLLVVLAVAPVARAGKTAAEATGSMRISGRGVVHTRLHVAEPARLSLNYWEKGMPAPEFSRGKGFAAVVLVPAQRSGQAYIAARLPRPNGIAQQHVSVGPDLCQLDRSCEVPPGTYRLYVVSAGPISVDIELAGLPGTSRLRVTSPAVGDLSDATESYYHSTQRGRVEMAAHGAGFSPELTGKSNLLFSAFWFHGPREDFGPAPADKPLLQVGDAGSCSYDGAPPADAYAPGCPGGHEDANFSTWRVFSEFEYLHWSSATNIGPGEYGDGYFAVHTGIRDPGFVGFWLDITA